MVIRLPHEVLPQHEVEKACGSHVLTAKEKRVFARIIAPKTIKRGVFTAKETQQIVDNWKAFCEVNTLTSHFLSSFCEYKSMRHEKFYPAQNILLHNRNYFSIQNKLLNL